MSFMIWYRVELAEVSGDGGLLDAAASLVGKGLPLRVSNDIFGGSFILDADVAVTMTEGASADSFEITLVNLPAATISLLQARHAAVGLTATVHLGYFDEPDTRIGAQPVISGRVVRVDPSPGEDGRRRTVIVGQETAGFLLRDRQVARSSRDVTSILEFTKSLLPTTVQLAPGSTMVGTLRDYTASAGSILGAVQELAQRTNAALVVRDGAVHLGAAVGRDPAPVVLHPDRNIVRRVDGQREVTAPPAADGGRGGRVVRTSLQLVVLGHPGLRVGQIATVTGLDDLPSGPLRIARVVHRFATSAGLASAADASAGGAGYTCELLLVAAPRGEPARTGGGVQGLVDRWQDTLGRHSADHPAIDVGVVTSYQSGSSGSDRKHRASVHYGQAPSADVGAPSVASPVRTDVELHSKPLASPFAFHKCGLVFPVYPGMRALLAHNRGEVNDAVVAGWLWAEQPRHEPPANEPGDYWLALPTAIGPDGLPEGPGANDLIDATGRRAVQVTSLHVTVGKPALPPLGKRPDPPKENALVIEHHSGTTITIDDQGALTIATKSTKLGLTNGTVSVTLDGAQVKVGQVG